MSTETLVRPPASTTSVGNLGHGAVPHRFVRLEPGVSGMSETWLDPADPIFAEHFPEWPVLPGSFVLRIALANAAHVAGIDRWRLVTLDRMAFRQGARPGTMLVITIEPAANGRFSFTATADSARIADGILTIAATGAP